MFLGTTTIGMLFALLCILAVCIIVLAVWVAKLSTRMSGLRSGSKGKHGGSSRSSSKASRKSRKGKRAQIVEEDEDEDDDDDDDDEDENNNRGGVQINRMPAAQPPSPGFMPLGGAPNQAPGMQSPPQTAIMPGQGVETSQGQPFIMPDQAATIQLEKDLQPNAAQPQGQMPTPMQNQSQPQIPAQAQAQMQAQAQQQIPAQAQAQAQAQQQMQGQSPAQAQAQMQGAHASQNQQPLHAVGQNMQTSPQHQMQNQAQPNQAMPQHAQGMAPMPSAAADGAMQSSNPRALYQNDPSLSGQMQQITQAAGQVAQQNIQSQPQAQVEPQLMDTPAFEPQSYAPQETQMPMAQAQNASEANAAPKSALEAAFGTTVNDGSDFFEKYQQHEDPNAGGFGRQKPSIPFGEDKTAMHEKNESYAQSAAEYDLDPDSIDFARVAGYNQIFNN